MKLFKVYNGFMGAEPTSVLVTAENKERAKELAEIAFQKEVVNPYSKIKVRRTYGPSYWNGLEAEVIFENCNRENASKTTD